VKEPLPRAWVSVALIPVGFILALAVGEGLFALLGYDSSAGDTPVWVGVVVGVPALLVFLLPCTGAVLYGNRARRAGARLGLLPMVIGGLTGGYMLVLTVAAVVSGAA
jgi:hypothetical protein